MPEGEHASIKVSIVIALGISQPRCIALNISRAHAAYFPLLQALIRAL